MAVATISLAPALLALRGGELASYHGVEHKAIGAYEDDREPAAASKEHERCGSHLVAPAPVGHRARQRGRAARGTARAGGRRRRGARQHGAAVEAFGWSERHPRSALARVLRRPGHEIQRAVGTREPTPEQLEVGEAALEEILRAEGAAAATPA